MKKILILLLSITLLGCEDVKKNEVEVDNSSPIVEIIKHPTIYTTTHFDLEYYISITDDSDYKVEWDYSQLIDHEGECEIAFSVSDIFGNEMTDILSVNVLNGMHEGTELDIVDYTEYAFTEAFILNVKESIEDPDISYIGLHEFVEKIRIDDIATSILREEPNVIQYQLFYTKKNGQMEFNVEENTIRISNRDILDNEYADDKNLLEEDENIDNSLLIDLNKYNLHMVQQDGEIYIPLYLASFLLTGRVVDLYELEEKVLLFDFVNIGSEEYTDILTGRKPEDLEVAAKHTYDFLALWLDIKYGLTKYKGIEDPYLLLAEYPGLKNPESVSKYYQSMSRFIASLDDLHTSLMTPGPRFPTYVSPTLSRTYDSPARYEYVCQFGKELFDFEVIDDIAFVKVNGFELNQDSEYYQLMKQASEYDTIVIDLSCNTGGRLSVSNTYLSYLTNHKFYHNQMDTLTGARYQDIVGTTNFIDADFYIFTSPITYSAGSLFTQIAKDNDFATIIGDETGGGSCSVANMVTPDGALIRYSSSSAQVDADFEIFDNGVIPDYYLTDRAQGKSWKETVVEFIKTLEEE